MGRSYIWCSTHSESPRKHAHPEATAPTLFDVTLGAGLDDRIVTAKWRSDGIDAMVSVSVHTLRVMLAVAEAYKPGATNRG